MMPWSGLSPASAEHANEIGHIGSTALDQHHVAVIALTTDRSMNPGRPQTRGKAKSDIGERGAVGIIYRSGSTTALLPPSLFA